jgi:mannose/fructose/N-acetylgalactosamine-specific phosphotransferase system component IIC
MTGSILMRSISISLAGGAISLDRTAAFQTMVSRPLVTAPLVGWMLGNPLMGLAVGVVLELLFIGDLPVGTHIPVNETGLAVVITSVIATALDAMGGPGIHEVRYFGVTGALLLFPPVLLLMIPLNAVYQWADALTRRINARFYHCAERSLESGTHVNLMKENLKGLLLFFLTGSAALFITLLPLTIAASYIGAFINLPFFFFFALAGCVILGVAAAFNAVSTDRSLMIFTAAGLGAAIYLVVLG